MTIHSYLQHNTVFTCHSLFALSKCLDMCRIETQAVETSLVEWSKCSCPEQAPHDVILSVLLEIPGASCYTARWGCQLTNHPILIYLTTHILRVIIVKVITTTTIIIIIGRNWRNQPRQKERKREKCVEREKSVVLSERIQYSVIHQVYRIKRNG